ncbi:MAG: hypothetical protein ABIG71_03730 [Candidatus Uhrbacteria bacterium]
MEQHARTAELRDVFHDVIYPMLVAEYGEALPEPPPVQRSCIVTSSAGDWAEFHPGVIDYGHTSGCFICGGAARKQHRLTALMFSRTEASRVVYMIGRGIFVVEPPSVPKGSTEWIPVVIGACALHRGNLERLEELTSGRHTISPRIISEAWRWPLQQRSDVPAVDYIVLDKRECFINSELVARVGCTHCFACGLGPAGNRWAIEISCKDSALARGVIELFDSGAWFSPIATIGEPGAFVFIAACEEHQPNLRTLHSLIRARRYCSQTIIDASLPTGHEYGRNRGLRGPPEQQTRMSKGIAFVVSEPWRTHSQTNCCFVCDGQRQSRPVLIFNIETGDANQLLAAFKGKIQFRVLANNAYRLVVGACDKHARALDSLETLVRTYGQLSTVSIEAIQTSF